MIKKSMIIRQFLALTLNAPAERRAQGGAALARAYLYGDLDTDALWEAKTALLSLLDDPAPSVRRALAEVCADSARAPRPIVVALSCDAFEVAEPILARSPVLTEADLVEAAALGDEAARAVIAHRHHLTPAVSGALAEIAALPTLVALAGNPTARITGGRLLRMIERFGHEADLREALLARHDLPPEVRHAVAVALARSLSSFAIERGWLGEARCERMNREVAERTALDLSAEAGAAATSRLVAYLRGSHQLNAGLILRAILSGRIEFAQTAFADLSGLDHASVARAMRDPRAVADLHRKAGLPAPLLPAMEAVLSAWRETARTAQAGVGAGLSRRMIERAIATCAGWDSPEIRSVVTLLTRFEAEAARDEARETTRAILAQAQAREAAERRRIAADAAWREALEAHRRAEAATATAPAVEPPAAGEGRTDPVGAILESLPDQILEWFRDGRDRKAEAAVPEAVLSDLDNALIAEFRASRAAPAKRGVAIAA